MRSNSTKNRRVLELNAVPQCFDVRFDLTKQHCGKSGVSHYPSWPVSPPDSKDGLIAHLVETSVQVPIYEVATESRKLPVKTK